MTVVLVSRSSDKLGEAVAALGGNTRAGSVEDAASCGDVVLFATPWAVTLDTARQAALVAAGVGEGAAVVAQLHEALKGAAVSDR